MTTNGLASILLVGCVFALVVPAAVAQTPAMTQEKTPSPELVGMLLLLCTDGLTEMVTDDLIGRVLERTGTAEENCRTLVDLALKQGGRDNVTVIVARYRFPDQVTV